MRLLMSQEPYPRLMVTCIAAWLTIVVLLLGFRQLYPAYIILIFWMTSTGLAFLSRKRANPMPAWMDAILYPVMGLTLVFMRGPGMWLVDRVLPMLGRTAAFLGFF